MLITSFDPDKKLVIHPASPADDTVSTAFSPDSTAVSTLFDKFVLTLQTNDDELSGMIFLGLRIPVNTVISDKYINYTQDIRGSLHKDKASRVLLLLDLGGVKTVVEYPYGKKVDTEISRRFPLKLKNEGNTHYSATLGIIVERKNKESSIFVQIDSLDVAVNMKKK